MKNVKFSLSKCGIELGSHNRRYTLAGSSDEFLGILHIMIASLYLLHKTETSQVFAPCSLHTKDAQRCCTAQEQTL